MGLFDPCPIEPSVFESVGASRSLQCGDSGDRGDSGESGERRERGERGE